MDLPAPCGRHRRFRIDSSRVVPKDVGGVYTAQDGPQSVISTSESALDGIVSTTCFRNCSHLQLRVILAVSGPPVYNLSKAKYRLWAVFCKLGPTDLNRY
jgi:hypothetical protein